MKKRLYFLLVCVGLFYACKDEEQVLLNADFISDRQTISAGEKVCFMDKSVGEPVRWDWAFEGGEPSVSNLFSPEIVYNYPGTYTVKLRVGRGTENAETEMLQYITVVYPDEISVAFKANKTQALSDETISFTDLSIGFPSAWSWEFIPAEGRTVTSTEQNPSLVFEPGVYSVKLTVTNPKTTATLTKENYLNIIDKNSVAADITADRRMVIEGGNVSFKDASLGRPTRWNWTFEGGTPSTSNEQTPTVTYSTAGRYKVTLVASNELNTSTAEQEGYITVLPGKDIVLFYPFEGDSKDMGPNAIHPEVLKLGDNMDVNFNAPARKEGFTCAEFRSKDNQNYAFLSLPDNDALDFQATPVTTSFWVKTSNKTAANLGVFQHGAGPNASTDGKNKQTWFRFQKSSPFIRYVIEYSGLSGNWTDYKTKAMTAGDNKIVNFLCHLVCVGVMSYALFLVGNYWLADPASMQEEEVVVQRKYQETHKKTRRVGKRRYVPDGVRKEYYLEVAFTNGTMKTLHVPLSTYNKTRQGATKTLTLQKGFFGLPVITKGL